MLLIFHPGLPQTNPFIILLTLGMVALAILIYFYINVIFGSFAFWSRDIWAPRFLLMVVMEIATGAMFLSICCPSLAKVMLFTPFPYLIYVPLKIYLGEGPQVVTHLATLSPGVVTRLPGRKGLAKD